MKKAELTNGEVRLIGRRGKEISSHAGVYLHDITMQLALRHPKRMITVDELTHVQYGRVTDTLRIYVRKRISVALNRLLDEGVLGFIEYDARYGGRGRVLGYKIYDAKSDKPLFERWLQRYKKRKEQTDDKLEQIRILLRRPALKA